MQEQKNPISVVVTGDVTIDWNIAHTTHELLEPTEWTGDANCSMNWNYGSAALLGDIIATMENQQKDDFPIPIAVIRPLPPKEIPDRSFDPNIVHSYAVWAQYSDKEACKHEQKKFQWRVKKFLGIDQRSKDDAEKSETVSMIQHCPSTANIVVIDDSNLGFRGKEEYWPQTDTALNETTPPWIIVKMSKPVADGALWKHLVSHFSERLIVVLTIDDLRQSEIKVCAQISWEKTAEELAWELTHNTTVNGLTNAAYTIISFGPTGALLMPGRSNKSDKTPILLFDPQYMEGEWPVGQGMMVGKTSTLVAGIVRQIMLNTDEPDFIQGIRSGVNAMRNLQKNGYEEIIDSPHRLYFPAKRIVDELKNENSPLAIAKLPTYDREKKSQPLRWTIFRDCYPNGLKSLSEQIVREGAETTLKDVPIGIFGKLITVDRQEIESLRSIQSLIGEYCTQKKERPLSIAVFGPPGSGKSFAVEQIALVANPDKIAEKTLTFNLSQFNSPNELIDAFHQIRDIALSGKIPLVFWDEFDTALDGKKLGWLRFFLAPMQDGKFQQGQITHPIGKAIFVFAGGTFSNADSFMNLLSEEDLTQELAKKLALEKASPSDEKTIEAKARESAIEVIKTISDAKVPDFLSRLKGFLNVLGPNRQKNTENNDPDYIVRRALLLRSFFAPLTHLFDEEKKLRIDPAVLRALLQIEQYRHGARSMDSIIAMSQLGNATHFNGSYLPSKEQLRLHVDPVQFIELLHQLKLEGDLLETLAKLNHLLFCKNLRKQHIILGTVTDEKADPKTHSSLKPYACLPEHEKEQNRGAVRDIPNKLARFGYAMVPGRNNEPDIVFPTDILEKMAELEHKRWMQAKFNDGWKHGTITDKDNKIHALLVEWDDRRLTEEEKDKDRRLVAESIPCMLRKAGYTIVKLTH